MQVKARVTKVQAQQLNVDVGNGVKGRVHITECVVKDEAQKGYVKNLLKLATYNLNCFIVLFF